MRIKVLTVPGCPNAPLAHQRIIAALAGQEAEIETVEVHDRAQAAELGMTGSPTIRLDGSDPFAPTGTEPNLSCRLYRQEDGTLAGAPSETALRAALAGTVRPETAAERCDVPILDVVGREGRGRRAPAAGGLRAVHQALLQHFAATGTAATRHALEPVAAGVGRTVREVLAELAAEDFVTLDAAGSIQAAYPFSAAPGRHEVRLKGGVMVWAMCAIDALGIPAMLDRDAVISSSDPVTGKRVTVTVRGGTAVWEPSRAVVFAGQRPGGGPAATTCCDALNFFTSRASARIWETSHPEMPGRVVDQREAQECAEQIFGHLLAP